MNLILNERFVYFLSVKCRELDRTEAPTKYSICCHVSTCGAGYVKGVRCALFYSRQCVQYGQVGCNLHLDHHNGKQTVLHSDGKG